MYTIGAHSYEIIIIIITIMYSFGRFNCTREDNGLQSSSDTAKIGVQFPFPASKLMWMCFEVPVRGKPETGKRLEPAVWDYRNTFR